MNEQQLGRDIKQALDEGLADLDRDVAVRLAAARQSALARTPMASGHGHVLSLALDHPWVSALLLASALTALIWSGMEPTPVEDNSDMDILMLTDDIPPQAFADWRLVRREDVGPLCFSDF